jgi:hypothetical protein
MKFVVIARDPQIDLYRESDLYGVEIVEAEDKDSAINISSFGELQGLFITAIECADDMELGECDLSDIRYKD